MEVTTPSEEAPSQAEILDLSDYLSHKRQQFGIEYFRCFWLQRMGVF